MTLGKLPNQMGVEVAIPSPESVRSAQSLLQFDAIMDGAPVGILFTQDGIMVQANASFVAMMGYQLNELIGQPASLLFFTIPESYAEIGRVAGPALAAGKPYRGDIRASHKDGSVFWSRFSARAVNPEKTEEGTLWFLEDVTPEHLHEEKLRRTLEEQRVIFESVAVGILYSHQRSIARCNNKLATMFGYQPEELLGRSTRLFFNSDEQYGELSRRVYPTLKAGQPYSVEMKMPHRDGHLIWVHATGSLVKGPVQSGDDVIWIFKDVSARKAAEEEKRQTLLELEAVFASAAVGFIYSRGHTVQRCNARCAEILGYSPEELIGQSTARMFPSQTDYQALRVAAGPTMNSGQSFETELRCKHKDGSLSWCRLYGKALNPEDISQGSIWILVDTEEARRTREQLTASMRDLEALMENATVGILFTRDQKITRYNPRFSEMYGYPGETAIGLPASIFFGSQEEYEGLSQIAYPLLAINLPLQTELYTQHANQEKQLWVKLIAYPTNPERPAEGTIWLVEDRTAYKEAEEALHKAQADLVQAEKQVALGSLVVGVAHELNTPIGNALMAASTLSDRCLEMHNIIACGNMRRSQLDLYLSDVAGLAGIVTRACERAAQLVSSFKQVAVDRRLERRRKFNLRALIDEVVVLQRQQLDGARWDITCDIPSSIECDSYPEPLAQIAASLLENAFTHAFVGAEHGSLKISATVAQGWVVLSFSDDGIGMDAAMLARVFDPFFTTRLGQGRSGLGLSITHNLATAVLGGDLTVESQPAQGTCFLLRFPVIAPQHN